MNYCREGKRPITRQSVPFGPDEAIIPHSLTPSELRRLHARLCRIEGMHLMTPRSPEWLQAHSRVTQKIEDHVLKELKFTVSADDQHSYAALAHSYRSMYGINGRVFLITDWSCLPGESVFIAVAFKWRTEDDALGIFDEYVASEEWKFSDG